ncbi:MAG: hypothetical protein ABSE22_11990 [Xanthobacteraceae bacterium]
MAMGYDDNVAQATQSAPQDRARLIRKLRWAGLEDEAKRLETAVRKLPATERGIVSFEPFSTD